jgi:hypothetical protein
MQSPVLCMQLPHSSWLHTLLDIRASWLVAFIRCSVA